MNEDEPKEKYIHQVVETRIQREARKNLVSRRGESAVSTLGRG